MVTICQDGPFARQLQDAGVNRVCRRIMIVCTLVGPCGPSSYLRHRDESVLLVYWYLAILTRNCSSGATTAVILRVDVDVSNSRAFNCESATVYVPCPLTVNQLANARLFDSFVLR